MKRQPKNLFFACLSIICASLAGCSPSLQWIAEPAFGPPTCVPDRLPTWDDFSKQDPPSATPAAQTAIRFLLNDSPPYLLAKFDPEYSWVKSKSANPSNPSEWIASERLLAHEQVHFLISCLLVRQGNHALQSGEDPQKMLELVKSVAQRINVQYDQDTKHGTDNEAQMNWEIDVQQQFEEVTGQENGRMVELQRAEN